MNNNHSRFFHHFMSKQMPCIIVPSCVTSSMPVTPSSPPPVPSTSNDHILNLSASMKKHCPLTPSETREREAKQMPLPDCSVSPEEDDLYFSKTNDATTPDKKERDLKLVDFNSNKVKDQKPDLKCESENTKDSECDSDTSENENGEHISIDNSHVSEIDVDESICGDGDDHGSLSDFGGGDLSKQGSETGKGDEKRSKSLAFGIDRILSFKSTMGKDQTSPTASSAVATSFPSPGSPRVVSSLSAKSDNSAEAELHGKDESIRHNFHHHSILSKLKLCTMQNNNENPRGSTPLSHFHHHHSYGHGPYRHHHNHQHHHSHMSSIIVPSSGGIHNQNSHHPLSHCPDCLFLRRYCGGASNNRSNNIPSSSSSSTNNVATNNMQFSSPLTTPCGPTSSSISASFTWMANPSIYDNSVISPVTGFNQHIPLQPSFGMSTSGFSSLATIHQQCNSGGGGGSRRKRSWSRAVFSNLQRKGLEKRFQIQKYITKPDRRQLAATLGLTDAQVKVWFQNRRMKWRHSKEGKVSSGTGESVTTSSSSPPVSSTTSTKQDGAMKDKQNK